MTEWLSHTKNHSSVLKIKSKFGSNLNSFDFQQITVSEVKKLLKDTGVNNAKSVVTIPLKLIKIGAETMAEPLPLAINWCLRQGIFLYNTKIASVFPIDKGKPNKYKFWNYRPGSILNAFYAIYEKVIKNQLGLPVISVCRKSCSTQQIPICLLEEWRG